LFTNVSIAEELTLPAAKDFLMDAQKVWKQKIPILIMFSIPGCGYCKIIKEDVLSPMATMDEYNKKLSFVILMRKALMRSTTFIMKKFHIMNLLLNVPLIFFQP
jgi:hypothetical protein